MFRLPAILFISFSLLVVAVDGSAFPDEPKREPPTPPPVPPRHMEQLGRGVVAIHQGEGKVFVSWRMLGTDPEAIAFNVYRKIGEAEPVKLTKEPLAKVTRFVDSGVKFVEPVRYFVRAVIGNKEGEPSTAFTLPANAPAQPYIAIPLKTLPGDTPNDASAGDLDGDGEYEIVVKQQQRPRDNSQKGATGETKLEAYKLDGTFLWRINLGKNIREGAHYTQFLVYDFDGDGKAEVMCKTADGTTDGAGKVIGDEKADHRNADGYILTGPEFLTVFEGSTGKALATVDYIPARGRVADWGDNYGNRVDRFLACVAYLDGTRPSAVFCRGYYTRAVLAAWNWRDGKLTKRWVFDSDDGTPGNRAYRGQGNHGISVGDVDTDGKDEIIYGSCAISSDGKGLHSTGLGHGDAMHFGDLDPDRPGLEVFKANGDSANKAGIQLRDAKSGNQIWGVASTGKDGVGRACALDIDPRHKGMEMWGRGAGVGGLFNAKGEKISDTAPRVCNMCCWWDGDLLRELLDGVTVSKWDHKTNREARLFAGTDHGCVSNNGTKANPCLCADILGDWREEIIARTRDGKELRIFTTTIPTEHRLYTLMHDPIYRLGIAWQNVSYNQPAHTGFYLGDGMKLPPPKPNIATERVK
ncbi:MAG: rhamnogalacturonan lyase [Planctomycetia bacterium]|nr:rhamnogalacturonan lyase [Planctomycetia bacterium]